MDLNLPTLVARQDNSSSVVSYSSGAIVEKTFALTTTVFTQPTDCQKPILVASGDYTNYWVPGTTHSTTTFFASATTCYPDNFYLSTPYVPVFSPAACPNGFTIVAYYTTGNPETTSATCCPSGAAFPNLDYCTRTGVTQLTTVNGDLSSTITGKYDFVYPAFTAVWESSDLPNFTPASAPLKAYNAAVSTGASTGASVTNGGATPSATNAPATQTSGGTSSTNTTSSDGGLSTGAKAGIGVGVALGVLLILGMLAWAIIERRKRRKNEGYNSTQQQTSEYRADNSYGGGYTDQPQGQGWRPPVELSPDNTRQELDGSEIKKAPVEMSPNRERAELYGGER